MSEIDTWEKCYPSAWKGIITPESFSHPAKFSSRLIERIYQHGIECGWLHEGSRIVDPFGGVGLGAWPALRYGMDWTGCELEPRFVALAQANIDAWNAKYSGRLARWGTARILQGDSRHLAQVIGAAEACISSPPFMQTSGGHNVTATEGVLADAALIARHSGGNRASNAYGYTEGQLGNLPPGDVDAVISSPPYTEQSEGVMRADKFKDPAAFAEMQRHKGHGSSFEAKLRSMEKENERANYGSTPGQLAALPPGAFEAAIGSPPFEDQDQYTGNRMSINLSNGTGATLGKLSIGLYGATPSNIGNDSGDTFWSAAREIVAQVYQVLAPGAHAVWVVKSYVKNKQLVDFPHQWQALCEACGFVTLHEHHALLVRHNGTSIDIDGNHHEHKTESKSFFRRLAEKNGSPRIDYETVLCMVKPGCEGGGWDGAISSPPYYETTVNPGNVGNQIRNRWAQGKSVTDHNDGYGQTPGQLGSLPPGSLSDAINRRGE